MTPTGIEPNQLTSGSQERYHYTTRIVNDLKEITPISHNKKAFISIIAPPPLIQNPPPLNSISKIKNKSKIPAEP